MASKKHDHMREMVTVSRVPNQINGLTFLSVEAVDVAYYDDEDYDKACELDKHEVSWLEACEPGNRFAS